ncbi:MAG: hypothetical protein EXS33_09090 [Pedosphaera sp.]|nr:hypothetical protein [Pedosphaera sp.]
MKSRHWLWLLPLPLLVAGLLRLKLNVEVLDLLPQNFSVMQGLKLYRTNFANTRELMITVRAPDAAQAEVSARALGLALRAATNLTASVTWQPLWEERPGESAELLAFLWLNQPPEIFGALTNRLAAANLSDVLRDAREALTSSLSPAEIARRGYDPLNLTQLPEPATGGNTFAEPGRSLTEIRSASRARWGIDTVAIGQDPFAFVEVIRRLEAGATVARLVGRLPAASAVTVELFGRPFAAAIAAAELARVSGCGLLPGYLTRHRTGYSAHMLPKIPYDRAALRSRETRQQLTQEIIRVFEPAIRQPLDHWYHFVPVGPKNPGASIT